MFRILVGVTLFFSIFYIKKSYSEPQPNIPTMMNGLSAGAGSSQDQFQRYEQHQQQLDALPPPSSDLQMKQDNTLQNDNRICMPIHKIAINGSYHLSKEVLGNIIRQYEGRCLGIKEFNKIINDLNNAYVKHGYITSRAYLPQQNLGSGVLSIVVIEGKLEEIDMKGHRRNIVKFLSFPGLKGHILNLRELEQGVEQMNRLPHFGAQMKIHPGKMSGNSRVEIVTPKQRILHGQVWTDNNGQKITGGIIGHAMAMAENLLGLLDMWSVEYDHSLIGPSHGSRGTSFLSANGSIPFGYWTIFGSWWQSRDAYPLLSGTDIYHMSGSRMDWRVGVSRTLWRHNKGVTTGQVSFERKTFGSQVDHTSIYSQSGRQAYVNATVSESLRALDTSWYITGGVKIGVDGVGSWSYYQHPTRDEPHRSYVKPSLDIDGYVPFKKHWLWHTTMHGEISTRDQSPTNELQVGGPYTVRGFLEQEFIGNIGGYMRNDVSWTPDIKDLKCHAFTGVCHSLLKGVQFYGAVDFGVVRAGYASRATPAVLKGGEMMGMGLGMRKTRGIFYWNVVMTHSVIRGLLPNEGLITFFSAGARL